MKITALSNEQYYPFCLSNGRDCCLINYDGSCFMSLNPHTHNEPLYGSPLGWYKTANIKKGEKYRPVVTAGIQVFYNGIVNEPTFFEQEFLPKIATVETVLNFRFGLKLKVSSFMTADSIWCERVEVLEKPANANYSIAFRVNKAFYASGCYYGEYQYKTDMQFNSNENTLSFTYSYGDYQGKGALIAEKNFDKVVNDAEYIEGHYTTLVKGDVLSRKMICLDNAETHTTYQLLHSKASNETAVLYNIHQKEWQEYFAASSITLPNGQFNYIYALSRYIIKAYQHPDTGLITLGLLPNHWLGALWCSWDAEFSHKALLSCGNFKESAKYANSYVKTAPQNYEALKDCGFPGVAFSGWTTVTGKFMGHTTLTEWLTNFKPQFCSMSVHAIYNEWLHNPEAITTEYKQIVDDVIAFWLARMIKVKNGLYTIIDIKDSDETGTETALDSWVQLDIAKAFIYAYEMFENEKYKQIGESMLKALERNRRSDGIIANSTGSEVATFPLFANLYTSKDGIITPENMAKITEKNTTVWGGDNETSMEEYRHWPWYTSLAVINYIIGKNPEKAMEKFKALTYGVSVTGAFPEKIRLDGHRVNYWYNSPHSLYVSAVNAAFAFSPKHDNILIAYGFTPDYGDCECRDIALPCGYKVSLKIQNGIITYLSVKNTTKFEKTVTLDINPLFSKGIDITIKANGEYVYISK